MPRRPLSRLAPLAAAACLLFTAFVASAPAALAAPVLQSVDYLCLVTFRLVVTRALPVTPTATGVANETAVTRYGNRELLEAVVAEHGGALADWRLVAHGNSETFEALDDLVIRARHRDGRLVPVSALDLADLSHLPASSDTYGVTRSVILDETLSATFDQKRVVTLAQPIADGDFDGGGTIASAVRFGPLSARGQTLRAFSPGRSTLDFVGTHTSPASGTGVARLTVSISTPRLVPVFANE
jgi:hypothetical protein